ncbi:MAG: extracellular solute-binding protein [Oscillospiraceae bacterium]|jgi:putative aldouronate transport system substrate-binding protein|nr:extracellular solute-binding protein [Oscillospiraceae bacterium]
MKSFMKKAMALTLVLALSVSIAACGAKPASSTPAAPGSTSTPAKDAAPLKVSIFYSDNPTLPFNKDWLALKEVQKICNVDLQVEAIPSTDYNTKVSLALNTGENAPDVILYQETKSENASLALNGAIVPISDYPEWTPNFNAKVKEFGLEEDVANLTLQDGKRYYMPALFDKPFYDGGLILREDYLKSKGFDAPKTFDDLYKILKAYKTDFPKSYPLTSLVAPYVTYRMTMTSFGVSVGKSNSSKTNALSYDYEKGEYFPGAISEDWREYLRFINKLYAEGLLDPEMAAPIDGDKWTTKMATGAAVATYAYYDQIGGIETASDIDGFKLQMYPSLAGPKGAHHQPKSKTYVGIMFPKKTAERKDFEQVVRAMDQMFFSEECSTIWCLGVEGVTYKMDGDKVVYADEIKNSKDGIYKTMQLKYGCGADPFQLVWTNAREMTKYDENYAAINKTVAGMENGNVIQPIPPTPLFDDLAAEDAASLQTPLADTIEVWIDGFVTGKKSLDKDWDAYVKELKDLQIEEFCKLYNDNLRK